MRKKITKNKRNLSSTWGALIFLLAIFAMLFILDYFNIPSNMGIDILGELNPWTELVASGIFTLISAVVAVNTVVLTINEQKENRAEDNRKEALPLIKIDRVNEKVDSYDDDIRVTVSQKQNFKGKSKNNLTNRRIRFKFINVGRREMYNIRITFNDSDNFMASDQQEVAPILYKNDCVNVCVQMKEVAPIEIDSSTVMILPDVNSSTDMLISVYYEDCYGNGYEQILSITIKYRLYVVEKNKKTYANFTNAKYVGSRIIAAPKME